MLQPLSRAAFERATDGIAYFHHRWKYMVVALDMAVRRNPERVLEIGAMAVSGDDAILTGSQLALFPGCDTMNIAGAPTHTWNAGKVPWPVQGQYDLVISLQTWEHVGNQQAAFCEVQRVARAAIISFPYYWDCPKDPKHHQITDEVIRCWTCNAKPAERVIVGFPQRPDNPERLILAFDFR